MNIVGISRTGSGKTLSFLIPAIDHIMAKRQTESSKFENSPTAIVVLPTRELCQQVEQVASSYLRPLGLNSVALYGGSSKNSQIRELQDGVDMVVATPGRLLDMMGRRRGGAPYLSLESTTFVTLDEADRMLDMGFESDVREIINSSLGHHKLSYLGKYRAGPLMIAIIFMKGTIYDCIQNYDLDQI